MRLSVRKYIVMPKLKWSKAKQQKTGLDGKVSETRETDLHKMSQHLHGKKKRKSSYKNKSDKVRLVTTKKEWAEEKNNNWSASPSQVKKKVKIMPWYKEKKRREKIGVAWCVCVCFENVYASHRFEQKEWNTKSLCGFFKWWIYKSEVKKIERGVCREWQSVVA